MQTTLAPTRNTYGNNKSLAPPLLHTSCGTWLWITFFFLVMSRSSLNHFRWDYYNLKVTSFWKMKNSFYFLHIFLDLFPSCPARFRLFVIIHYYVVEHATHAFFVASKRRYISFIIIIQKKPHHIKLLQTYEDKNCFYATLLQLFFETVDYVVFLKELL